MFIISVILFFSWFNMRMPLLSVIYKNKNVQNSLNIVWFKPILLLVQNTFLCVFPSNAIDNEKINQHLKTHIHISINIFNCIFYANILFNLINKSKSKSFEWLFVFFLCFHNKLLHKPIKLLHAYAFDLNDPRLDGATCNPKHAQISVQAKTCSVTRFSAFAAIGKSNKYQSGIFMSKLVRCNSETYQLVNALHLLPIGFYLIDKEIAIDLYDFG